MSGGCLVQALFLQDAGVSMVEWIWLYNGEATGRQRGFALRNLGWKGKETC